MESKPNESKIPMYDAVQEIKRLVSNVEIFGDENNIDIKRI